MDNSKVEEKIYCFWTGDNPITPNRLQGLKSMHENLGVPIEFLDKKGIEERILPEAPLHPGYKYLSAVHKSDYLRCYFMHHFGGGYADIKIYSRENNWRECFSLINKNLNIDLIGKAENLDGLAYGIPHTNDACNKCIQTSYFISRANTEFTRIWYQRLIAQMDRRYDELVKFPASSPFGGTKYTVRWAELLGELFHSILVSYSGGDKNGRVSRMLLPGRTYADYR